MLSDSRFKGISRNRIADLHKIRGHKKHPPKRFSKAALRKTIQDDDSHKSSLLTDETKSSQIEMAMIDQPNWLGEYGECVNLLKETEEEIKLEKKRKMHSVSQKKHDQIIQQFVERATKKLNLCEKKLKQMESFANFNNEGTRSEQKTFTNMLVSMANNIRVKARELRAQQQAELHREREMTSYTRSSLGPVEVSENEVTQWLSEQDLESIEVHSMKERNEQINKIVQSIYSLNAVYKQLQNLVIEQGSLLDRIDENIDKTQAKVEEAVGHLRSANDRQDSRCFYRARLMLIVAIVIFLVIFMIKHI